MMVEIISLQQKCNSSFPSLNNHVSERSNSSSRTSYSPSHILPFLIVS